MDRDGRGLRRAKQGGTETSLTIGVHYPGSLNAARWGFGPDTPEGHHVLTADLTGGDYRAVTMPIGYNCHQGLLIPEDDYRKLVRQYANSIRMHVSRESFDRNERPISDERRRRTPQPEDYSINTDNLSDDFHDLYAEESYVSYGLQPADDIMFFMVPAGRAVGSGVRALARRAAPVAEEASASLTSNLPAVRPAYPPDNGAVPGTRYDDVLHIGSVVDRYGDARGRFVSPLGTALEARALPPWQDMTYNQYVVLRPLSVQSSGIMPWFGQAGLGTQHMLPMSIEKLVRFGLLQNVGP